MSTDDSLEILREAGFRVDELPDEIREVLSGLSAEEARTLVTVQEKVNEATPEVAGYGFATQHLAQPMHQPDKVFPYVEGAEMPAADGIIIY